MDNLGFFTWAYLWLGYFTFLAFGIIFLVLVGQNRFKSEVTVTSSA